MNWTVTVLAPDGNSGDELRISAPTETAAIEKAKATLGAAFAGWVYSARRA